MPGNTERIPVESHGMDSMICRAALGTARQCGANTEAAEEIGQVYSEASALRGRVNRGVRGSVAIPVARKEAPYDLRRSEENLRWHPPRGGVRTRQLAEEFKSRLTKDDHARIRSRPVDTDSRPVSEPSLNIVLQPTDDPAVGVAQGMSRSSRDVYSEEICIGLRDIRRGRFRPRGQLLRGRNRVACNQTRRRDPLDPMIRDRQESVGRRHLEDGPSRCPDPQDGRRELAVESCGRRQVETCGR